jgi:hypothetical protein
VSTQVEIIYASSHNSKETGEIFRISPRKSARGIRPLNRNDEKWAHTRQIKIVGRNHILPPLMLIMQS